MAYDYSAKIIVLGDAFTGKTSLIQSIVHKTFTPEEAAPTIGVEYEGIIVSLGNKKIKAMVWDTAGQESFRSLIAGYYRQCAGVIIVFDVTEKKSFDNLNFWIKEVKEKNEGRDVSILILANKVDKTDSRLISRRMIESFCERKGIQFLETSARKCSNTDQIFQILLNNIMINNMISVKENSGVKLIDFESDNIKPRDKIYCPSCF